MVKINENYLLLQNSDLFVEVNRRAAKYMEENPEKNVIKMGIGDVTKPLVPTVIKAFKDAVDEMAEAENPTQIKDDTRTPEELIVFNEMSNAIKEAMKKLPPRERDLIEAKFFKDKKLRELSDDFNISPSRISRIIQSGLNKIKKELEKHNLSE